jgi:hypothetical protein
VLPLACTSVASSRVTCFSSVSSLAISARWPPHAEPQHRRRIEPSPARVAGKRRKPRAQLLCVGKPLDQGERQIAKSASASEGALWCRAPKQPLNARIVALVRDVRRTRSPGDRGDHAFHQERTVLIGGRSDEADSA